MKIIKDGEEPKMDINVVDKKIRVFLNNNPLHQPLTTANPLTSKERFDNIIYAEDILMMLHNFNIELQHLDIFYSDILDIVFNLELEIVMEKSRLNILRTLKYPKCEMNEEIINTLYQECMFNYKRNTRHYKKTIYPELHYFCTLQENIDMDFIWDSICRKLETSILKKDLEDIKQDIFTKTRALTLQNIINE